MKQVIAKIIKGVGILSLVIGVILMLMAFAKPLYGETLFYAGAIIALQSFAIIGFSYVVEAACLYINEHKPKEKAEKA